MKVLAIIFFAATLLVACSVPEIPSEENFSEEELNTATEDDSGLDTFGNVILEDLPPLPDP